MIPMSRPTFGPEEERAALEVMRSGQLAQVPRVRAFEEAFAAATGARYDHALSDAEVETVASAVASPCSG